MGQLWPRKAYTHEDAEFLETNLAPHVGADLEVMRRDSQKMRGERPFLMVSLRDKEGVPGGDPVGSEQLASHARSS